MQEKEKEKAIRAEKAATRLKKKAVLLHEHFKEATRILREHRMGAKNVRRLLKRHYVALIEDAGGVKDPVVRVAPFLPSLNPPCAHIHLPPPLEKENRHVEELLLVPPGIIPQVHYVRPSLEQ